MPFFRMERCVNFRFRSVDFCFKLFFLVHYHGSYSSN